MEKYTGKMIPFDIEKFNAGYEPVYRNGNPVKRVIQTPECNSDSSKLFSIGSDGGWCNHYESGRYLIGSQDENDLMLKAKEVTFWHNWYMNGRAVCTTDSYETEQKAKVVGENIPATIQI